MFTVWTHWPLTDHCAIQLLKKPTKEHHNSNWPGLLDIQVLCWFYRFGMDRTLGFWTRVFTSLRSVQVISAVFVCIQWWYINVNVDCLLCSEFLEMDLKPSEESVDHWREMFVKYTTRFANDIRHIVLFEDIVDSLKACCISLCTVMLL